MDLGSGAAEWDTLVPYRMLEPLQSPARHVGAAPSGDREMASTRGGSSAMRGSPVFNLCYLPMKYKRRNAGRMI